jgi:hypothetical protein
MMVLLWGTLAAIAALLVVKLMERTKSLIQTLTEIESNANRMYQSVGLNLEQYNLEK